MNILGSTITLDFTTQTPDGSTADADALPSGVLVREGVDTAETVSITRKRLGVYTVSVAIPAGWSIGDEVQIRLSATVAGVTGAAVIWTATITGAQSAQSGTGVTALAEFHDAIRTILGDRLVLGMWNYPDPTIDSALKTTFRMGRAPEGYALVNAGTAVSPEVASGDDYAWIVYDAALLLIGGEDGAMSYRTRALSVTDQGHRKRDLLAELKQMMYEIRDGAAIFSTTQSFIAFMGNMPASGGCGSVIGPALLEFTTFNLRSGVQDLAI